MDSFNLVSSLQALPETDPIEVDGIQFGGGTCQSGCTAALTVIVNTICILAITKC